MTDTTTTEGEPAPQRPAEAQSVPGDVAAEELPDEAAELAKDAVRDATGADDAITKRDEQTTPEELLGGPAVETDAQTEIADEPAPGGREPLPRPMPGD